MEMRSLSLSVLVALAGTAGCGSFSPVDGTSDASANGLDGGATDGAVDPSTVPLATVGKAIELGGAGLPQTVGIAVDETNLFITTGAAIYVRSKADTVTDFGTPLVGNLNGSQYVALGDNRVFWAEFGSKAVLRTSKNGTDPKTVMNGPMPDLVSPAGVALANGRVWGTDYGGGKVFSLARDASGEAPKIAGASFASQNPEGLAADGKTLYIALNKAGRIVSIDTDNPTTATQVVDAPGAAGLAFDGKTRALYYTSQADPFGVYRWRRGMETPERIADCDSSPGGIALDDAHVYWVTRDGQTARVFRATK